MSVPERSRVDVSERMKKRAVLFKVMSLLWVFPSTGAICLLGMGAGSTDPPVGLIEAVRKIAFDHWTAFGVVGAHLVFLVLALHYHRSTK